MANKKRGKTAKTLRYFFLNGDLHKTLIVNRPEDLLIAWNYPKGERVAYILSDSRSRMQRAYSFKDVAKIFGRYPDSIKRYVNSGSIRPPQRTYTIGQPEKKGRYFFSEDDIRGLHDYIITVSLGRPRFDGMKNPTNAPSRKELEAILRNDTILYVKGDNGDFLPVWKQPEW
jgi:hypothetical protein